MRIDAAAIRSARREVRQIRAALGRMRIAATRLVPPLASRGVDAVFVYA